MPYLALARKWRPQRFDQIVGQSHIVQALSHALLQSKLHHAYLFTGTHGIGKTTIARIFAKCLNCETGITDTPCETCSNCNEINTGRFPDLYEIDAASRTKVEDTRDLLDSIPYAPTKGRFKVYLIDEVHMLSGHSFNALLKTLEEPPEHVKFLLATTDSQKLPATVLSRCLQFHLSKMTTEQIEAQLAAILNAEKIKFESAALAAIAESAHGSMRDALSLLDQSIAYSHGSLKTAEIQTLLGLTDHIKLQDLLTAIDTKNASAVFDITKSWADNGVNFARVLTQLLALLHHAAVMQAIGKSPVLALSAQTIQHYYQIALNGQKDLLLAPTPHIGFEMIALRMMSLEQASSSESLKKTPQKTVPTHWNSLINTLELTGATLALAKQCAQISFTDETLNLSLQPKFKALFNARHQTSIQAAVTKACHRPMTVTITITENAQETPAEADELARTAKMQSAKKAISADPSVQRIIKTFDANLVEESIKPQ